MITKKVPGAKLPPWLHGWTALDLGGRDQQQDAIAFQMAPRRGDVPGRAFQHPTAFCVCDGLGGHGQGSANVARKAADAFVKTAAEIHPRIPLGEVATSAMISARSAGVSAAGGWVERRGPDTAILGGVVHQDGSFVLIGRGDCRAFILRGLETEQPEVFVTEVHRWGRHGLSSTLIGHDLDNPGVFGPSPETNLHANALGWDGIQVFYPAISYSPRVGVGVLRPGDWLILASDGAWDPESGADVHTAEGMEAFRAAPRQHIVEAVQTGLKRSKPNPAAEIVARARAHKSTDNAAVIAFWFKGTSPEG